MNFEYGLEEEDYRVLENEMIRYNVIFEKLEKLLFEDTFVIAFNYTGAVKLYTDNYYFVHGLISQDEKVVLGCVNDNLSGLCQGEYLKYSKTILGERLCFWRFIQSKGYDEQGYELNGLKEESPPIIEYVIVNDFGTAEEKNNYSKGKEIVIMGHGLESDLDYIQSIFAKVKRKCYKKYQN